MDEHPDRKPPGSRLPTCSRVLTSGRPGRTGRRCRDCSRAPTSMWPPPWPRWNRSSPIHRLEGESIRDAILAVSGRLDQTLYGPSIQPYREEPKDYRKLFQGPLDGNGRRSIYIKVTRHEGSRFLETFDFPNPAVTRGNRDTTNVPSQYLAMSPDTSF